MKIGADDPTLGEAMNDLYEGADAFAFADPAPPRSPLAARVVVRVFLYTLIAASFLGGLAVFVEIVRRYLP